MDTPRSRSQTWCVSNRLMQYDFNSYNDRPNLTTNVPTDSTLSTTVHHHLPSRSSASSSRPAYFRQDLDDSSTMESTLELNNHLSSSSQCISVAYSDTTSGLGSTTMMGSNSNTLLTISPTSPTRHDEFDMSLISPEENHPAQMVASLLLDDQFFMDVDGSPASGPTSDWNKSSNGNETNTQLSNSQDNAKTSSPPSSSEAGLSRKTTNRRNPWGKATYSDIISSAIENSPGRRATLQQIYDYVVANYDYFRTKSLNGTNAGWKNSIRHNLSLHGKFVKCPKTDSSKSSYWSLNYEAKTTYVRRRGGSLDANRAAVMKKKTEPMRERSSTVTATNSSTYSSNDHGNKIGSPLLVSIACKDLPNDSTLPESLLVYQMNNPCSNDAVAMRDFTSPTTTNPLLSGGESEPRVMTVSSSSLYAIHEDNMTGSSVGDDSEEIDYATRRLCLDLARYIFFEEQMKLSFGLPSLTQRQSDSKHVDDFDSTTQHCLNSQQE